ncbi:MAG TPA: DUF1287 domain-containing protein [Alphaproteobacteria bacterium]|nr:DUF1287 domain-containing protein [Alphaproteobacteria bacterium]
MGRLLVALLLILSSPSLGAGQSEFVQKVIEGAYAQVGTTLLYDPSYRRIAYPGGDVPIYRGVCSDVIVRAYRNAGVDLQLLVHRDMEQSFDAYPRIWGLSHPDANIDHRRVPNLAVFFARHGQSLPISADLRDYRPGDIVTWRLPGGQPHIGLVSDRVHNGKPLMVHNIGWGAQVEDVLFDYTITGHYRYVPKVRSSSS